MGATSYPMLARFTDVQRKAQIWSELGIDHKVRVTVVAANMV